MKNNGKQWYKSKTIRFNGAMLTVAVAILGTPELLDVIVLMPEAWRAWLLGVIPLLLAVGNIFLRFVTGEPIVNGFVKGGVVEKASLEEQDKSDG